MSKSSKKVGSKKTKIIVLAIVILVLLAGGAAAAYYFYFGPQKTTTDTSNNSDTSGTAYKTTFDKAQDKVYDLITSGDKESIDEANQIVEKQVTAADESGNDAYIVDAYIAKSTLLIETGKSQEALDTILIPLSEKYGNNETYKYVIYGNISWAYRELDQPEKADQYYEQIPGQGWD